MQSRHTVFSAGAGRAPIILCSARVSHPDTDEDAASASRVWIQYRVGTSLNMAHDVHTTAVHRALWARHSIASVEMPLRDLDLEVCDVPASLADDVVAIYAAHELRHGCERAFMVNCWAGANRSALAVALLLWRCGSWPSVEALISFMREQQRAQRGPGALLLTNFSFIDYLAAHCV